jgi:hypothetical protein
VEVLGELWSIGLSKSSHFGRLRIGFRDHNLKHGDISGRDSGRQYGLIENTLKKIGGRNWADMPKRDAHEAAHLPSPIANSSDGIVT